MIIPCCDHDVMHRLALKVKVCPRSQFATDRVDGEGRVFGHLKMDNKFKAKANCKLMFFIKSWTKISYFAIQFSSINLTE